jgi:hypothetical protein
MITRNPQDATPTRQIIEYFLNLDFIPGQEFWLGARHDNNYSLVFKGILGEDSIELWRCEEAGKDENGRKIWQAHRHIENPVAHLRELGRQGYNISAYPNHMKGGINAGNASKFTTCFFEIDDLSLDDQKAKLDWLAKTLNLTPAMTVYTGGKSLHNYFALSEPVDRDTWIRINRKLTAIVRGDTAIPSPARGMRLPGIIRYLDKIGEYREVEIISTSPARYSPQEFEAALDSTGLFPYGIDDERWRQWTRNKSQDYAIFSAPPAPPRKNQPVNVDPDIFTGACIPLEISLSLYERDLLTRGAGQGSRDMDGFRLACGIAGLADWYQRNGVFCNDDPLRLFEDYAARCSPPLSPRDTARIWKSALRANPSPSLPDDAIQNCIKAYLYRQNPRSFSPKYAKKPGISTQTITKAQWVRRFKLPQGLAKIQQHLERAGRQLTGRYLKPAKGFGGRPVSTQSMPVSGSAIVPTYQGIDVFQHPDFTINRRGERVFVYRPGILPLVERWNYLGRPRIQFQKKDRLALIAEARAKGYSHIKDESGTGSGKSYDLGFISLNDFPGMERVLYLSDDAENPTTASVETNFERFVTRHDGQKLDHSHKTPTGHPYKRRVKNGESAEIPGNCPENQTFLKLHQKGLGIGGGADSPICQSCPLLAGCEFLSMRKQQLNHSALLRAHPDQITSDMRAGKQTIAVWDEPGKILKLNQVFKFHWNEINRALQILANQNPDLHEVLVQIFTHIYNKLASSQINPRFGMSFVELKNLLGLEELIDLPTPDGTYRKANIIRIAKEADKLLNPSLEFSGIQTPAQKQEWIDSEWHPHYFSLMFGALTGHHAYSTVTVDAGWNFTVSLPYSRHQKIIGNMGLNIWLDATLTTEDLAAITGIQQDKFLVTEEEQADYSNLTIKIVGGVGSCGINRETEGMYSQNQRIKNLLLAIEKLAPGSTGLIDFKRYINDEDIQGLLKAGYWYVDNRGSNAFRDLKQLIAVGAPVSNLGALAGEFQALTGIPTIPTDLSGDFGQWVQRRTTAEIMQLVGRLRAQLSQDEKTCWLVGDNHPQEIVEQLHRAYPGCKVEFVDVTDICVSAAKKGTQQLHAMVAAAWDMVQAGTEVTTSAIALKVGVARSRISQLTRVFGGFDAFKEVLIFLLEAIKGKLTPPNLSHTLRSFASKFLPGVLDDVPRNVDPPPLSDEKPAAIHYKDEDIALDAEMLDMFSCRPWEYASGLAEMLEMWGAEYLSLVWQKLGMWPRRFVRSFGPQSCRLII